MIFYEINNAVGSDGDLSGDVILPKDSNAMTKYGDDLREKSPFAIFPSGWAWLSEEYPDAENQNPIKFDFPPSIGFGLVMRSTVFEKVKSRFRDFFIIKNIFSVNGEGFTWFNLPIVSADQISQSEFHLSLGKPGYKLHCSQEFRDFWIKNEFTGIDFLLTRTKNPDSDC
jgi:hypothetical protein